MTTLANTKTNSTDPRIANALDRLATMMAADEKRKLKEHSAQRKAVLAAFEAWLDRARLADRQAFLETLAARSTGTAATRIAGFAERMVEGAEAMPAALGSSIERAPVPSVQSGPNGGAQSPKTTSAAN
ncbi:hypothetical protein [Paragemmobacter straminiformis]|uniref:Uncharacterized protein n=1 Tax=Paragemmobacter straminiformis TaxID=2045119 RepID=A0A842IAA0_9RHOB|nr:hypothetical protein [Gemmobacter straminiformis]MBC2836521.1 hypothetical protein [Gemmobacter straminiformis]